MDEEKVGEQVRVLLTQGPNKENEGDLTKRTQSVIYSMAKGLSLTLGAGADRVTAEMIEYAMQTLVKLAVDEVQARALEPVQRST